MAAGGLSFVLEQGSRFSMDIIFRGPTGTPINLTGYGVEMAIREKVDSPSRIITLSSANGRIVFASPRSTGKITLVLASEVTAGLSFDTAVYDLVLTDPSGQRKRMLEGTVTFSRAVTR